MAERSIVVMGLPASGKTTYLAALWHLVTSGEVETTLRFGGLSAGKSEHLNAIAERWRDAMVQERTLLGGNRVVSMNLVDAAGQSVRVTFPDLPGEAYQRMWEDRDCEAGVANVLRNGDVLLFVHADTIRAPFWVVRETVLSRAMGLEGAEGEPREWKPSFAPTQVQLVDFLQLLRTDPLDVGPRRVAVMLSAWDRAREERLKPAAYLEAKLPLLDQYLRGGADGWICRVYGVSAQGGEYDRAGEGDGEEEAEQLRLLDQPSTRIEVVGVGGGGHDLTEPLRWLMG